MGQQPGPSSTPRPVALAGLATGPGDPCAATRVVSHVAVIAAAAVRWVVFMLTAQRPAARRGLVVLWPATLESVSDPGCTPAPTTQTRGVGGTLGAWALLDGYISSCAFLSVCGQSPGPAASRRNSPLLAAFSSNTRTRDGGALRFCGLSEFCGGAARFRPPGPLNTGAAKRWASSRSWRGGSREAHKRDSRETDRVVLGLPPRHMTALGRKTNGGWWGARSAAADGGVGDSRGGQIDRLKTFS